MRESVCVDTGAVLWKQLDTVLYGDRVNYDQVCQFSLPVSFLYTFSWDVLGFSSFVHLKWFKQLMNLYSIR